jgi:hypothetical protein
VYVTLTIIGCFYGAWTPQPSFFAPVSRHSVLMLFLDEHQPTFALPPALPPAAVQHRLTANALLASVAQLYRVALSKKETYVMLCAPHCWVFRFFGGFVFVAVCVKQKEAEMLPRDSC